MKRKSAIETLHEILENDTYGFRDSMTNEQIESVQMALDALEFQESMCCGECLHFTYEDIDGYGWCQKCSRRIRCDNEPCDDYE